MQRPSGALAWLVWERATLTKQSKLKESEWRGWSSASAAGSAGTGEEVHDPLIDLAQREHLAGRLLDGHGDERCVRSRAAWREGSCAWKVLVSPPPRLRGWRPGWTARTPWGSCTGSWRPRRAPGHSWRPPAARP